MSLYYFFELGFATSSESEAKFVAFVEKAKYRVVENQPFDFESSNGKSKCSSKEKRGV